MLTNLLGAWYSSGQKKVPVPFSYYDRITVLPFLLRSCESIAGTVRNNNRFSIVLTRGKDKIRARAAAMVFSTYKLQRILFYFFQGYKSPTIARFLKEKDGGSLLLRRAFFWNCLRMSNGMLGFEVVEQIAPSSCIC